MPRTAWNAPRLCRCALIICVLHIYVHRLEASRDCNAGATEHHGEPAPGSTHNASSARAEVAHLHGDHHPPVNIKFDDPALRYKYDEDGTVTSMEVHAWVRGCVVGFSYLVVVEYPDGGMSWEQDLTMLDGASSLHFVAVFAKPQPRAKHRLVTWVVDTHPMMCTQSIACATWPWTQRRRSLSCWWTLTSSLRFQDEGLGGAPGSVLDTPSTQQVRGQGVRGRLLVSGCRGVSATKG